MILLFHETYLHHQKSFFLFIEKNRILKFRIILEYMKHSNNNREALTLHKYVNNGTSAKVTSSAGIFWRDYFPWAIVPQKMPARRV